MTVKLRKKKKINNLNLIPILDAVFIFIFFLLMSAQFLEIYEIGSNLPHVADAETIKDKKEPLSLTLEVKYKWIQVKTGLDGRIIAKILRKDKIYDFDKLHSIIYQLKKENIEENMVVLIPSAKVKYRDLIRIIDEIKEIKKDEDLLYRKDTLGKVVKTKMMFDQVVFANLAS